MDVQVPLTGVSATTHAGTLAATGGLGAATGTLAVFGQNLPLQIRTTQPDPLTFHIISDAQLTELELIFDERALIFGQRAMVGERDFGAGQLVEALRQPFGHTASARRDRAFPRWPGRRRAAPRARARRGA